MSFLFDAFAGALAFFYQLVPVYAFAIVALTVVVMAALTPLTFKGTRSMMVMQRLQPEIKRIQSRYKDDRQKQNEELLKFYKENNINPVGGCLPLIVQMPIFIVLYNVLRGLTQRVPVTDVGFNVGQIGAGVPLTVPPFANFDPAYLNHSTDMYQSLSQTNTMNFLGMDLAQSANEELRLGVVNALPYLLLIAVVAVTGVVQQRQISGRNTGQTVSSQQQTMMKIMPLVLPIFSFTLPSGLVLYFVVSNLWRIGQQAVISKTIYGDDKKTGGSSGSKGPDTTKKKVGAGATAGAKAIGQAKGSGRSSGAKAEKSVSAANSKGAGGANGAKKQSAKAGTPPTSRSKSSGRTTPARSQTDGKAASAPARNEKSSKPSGRSSSTSSSTPTTPALQPRARKNKKR